MEVEELRPQFRQSLKILTWVNTRENNNDTAPQYFLTIMPNTSDIQKTLEVKIRPYSNQNNQERPDQKGVSRVHVCREVLLDLRLESGQPCYLWKTSENKESKKEAIVWLTGEKSLSKKIVQMSKTFQEAYGFKLGDDLNIQAAGTLAVTESIMLRDITLKDVETTAELSDEDKPHWEWFLRESLGMQISVYIV